MRGSGTCQEKIPGQIVGPRGTILQAAQGRMPCAGISARSHYCLICRLPLHFLASLTIIKEWMSRWRGRSAESAEFLPLWARNYYRARLRRPSHADSAASSPVEGGILVLFSHLLSKESVVGIDIGSSSIKVVCIEPTRQGPRISQVAICPTPHDSVKEGVVTNPAEVANAIQFALRSAGIKAATATTAIAGAGVTVRNVKVPNMGEDALRKSIRFEAGKFISSSIEDSIVEFDIVGDPDEEGQVSAVVVAAPRAMVETKVTAIEMAGLEPVSVDVEAFAFLRAFQSRPDSGIPAEGTIALLDMGASHTEINLVTNGEVALTRTIPIAGNNLSLAVRNACGCTDEEAEALKCSVNLQDLLQPATDETRDDTALKAVQPLVDELLREIRRSINYHQSQLPEGSDATVDTLLFTGGTARLKGLVDYTKSRLNMTAVIGSTVLSSMYDFSSAPEGVSEDDVPLLAVGIGLALKELPAASLSAVA